MNDPAASWTAWQNLRALRLAIWLNKVPLAVILILFLLLPSIFAWCGAARLAAEYSFAEVTGQLDLNSRKTITLLFLQSALKEHQDIVQNDLLTICSKNNEIRFTVRADNREQADAIASGLVVDLSRRFSDIALDYFQERKDRFITLSKHYSDLAAVYALALDHLQATQAEETSARLSLERLLADTLQKRSVVVSRIGAMVQLMADLEEDKVRSSITVQFRNLQISRYLAALVCFAIAALFLIVYRSSRIDFTQKGCVSD